MLTVIIHNSGDIESRTKRYAESARDWLARKKAREQMNAKSLRAESDKAIAGLALLFGAE